MYNSSDLDRQHQLMRLRLASSSLLAEFRPSTLEAESSLERFISNSASSNYNTQPRHQMPLEEETIDEKNRFQNRMVYPPPPTVVSGSSGSKVGRNPFPMAGEFHGLHRRFD